MMTAFHQKKKNRIVFNSKGNIHGSKKTLLNNLKKILEELYDISSDDEEEKEILERVAKRKITGSGFRKL